MSECEVRRQKVCEHLPEDVAIESLYLRRTNDSGHDRWVLTLGLGDDENKVTTTAAVLWDYLAACVSLMVDMLRQQRVRKLFPVVPAEDVLTRIDAMPEGVPVLVCAEEYDMLFKQVRDAAKACGGTMRQAGIDTPGGQYSGDCVDLAGRRRSVTDANVVAAWHGRRVLTDRHWF